MPPNLTWKFQQKTINMRITKTYFVKRALIVSFDGISGSGKDTCIKLAKKDLEKLGKKAVVIEEVKLNPFAEHILFFLNQNLKKSELMACTGALFNVGRKYVHEKHVRNLLNKKIVIIFNRSYVSTLAQQATEKFRPETIKKLNDELGIIKADIKFLLFCRPETAYYRTKNRVEESPLGGRFTKTIADFKKISNQYLKAGKMEKCIFINTDESTDKVNEKILSVILKRTIKK